MAITPLTPRRSKRGQPIVATTSTKAASSSKGLFSGISWKGKSLGLRDFNPVYDLQPADLGEWEEREERDPTGLKTRLYDQFERKTTIAQKTSAKKPKSSLQSVSVETYKVGDTVLVMTNYKQPSIAVIVGMWETDFVPADSEDAPPERTMNVRIHWFTRPGELGTIRAKREHLENEIYYSLAQDTIISPSMIISHCSVSSSPPPRAAPSPHKRRGPTYVTISSDEDSSDEDEELPIPSLNRLTRGKADFCCFLAVEARRGIFCNFDWETHHHNSLVAEASSDISTRGIGDVWNIDLSTEAASSRKPKRPVTPRGKKATKRIAKKEEEEDELSDLDLEDSGEEYEQQEDSSDDDVAAVPTDDEEDDDGAGEDYGSDHSALPKSRKRKRAMKDDTPRTPRKRSRTVAHPTPHSKRALARRSSGKTPASPRKRKNLVIHAPEMYSASSEEAIKNLPKDPWLRAMHVLHVGSRPDAAGALKGREDEFTRILKEVGELVEEGQGGCVYISGVPGTGKTATVHAVVRELKRMAKNSETSPFTYVEINGLKIPEPSAAYTLLWEKISGNGGSSKMSSKESLKALTKYFSSGGSRGPGGHACVVLMDELDQLFTSSKQDVVYNFFNWPTLLDSKLVVIAVANTMDLPERVLEGRVRSRLGMVRINFQPYTKSQLVGIVNARLQSAQITDDEGKVQEVISVDAITFAAMKISGISGDARRVLDICRRAVEIVAPRKKAARISDVKEVIQMMQNSPTAAYLRECSFHERVMLAALVKCIKREGVEEIKWGEIQHQHMLYTPILCSSSESSRRLTARELVSVLDSLVSSRAMLVEDGVAISRKSEDERKVVMNLEMGEVERVLAEIGGSVWKNIL